MQSPISSETAPLVSYTICTYNQELYIRGAIASAFAQEYPLLEIIISDDCSTDNTYSIACEMVKNYSGPHAIILNQNEKNLGLIAHVNKIFSMAKGELIIGNAGDDIAFPYRTAVMVEQYIQQGRKEILIYGDVYKIDKNNKIIGLLKSPPTYKKSCKQIAVSNAIYIGASSAFSRKLIDRFEPIKYENTYEDLIWGFRAALTKSLFYLPEPTVKYRVGVGVSSNDVKYKNFKEFLRADINYRWLLIKIMRQRLLDTRHFKKTDFLQDERGIVKSIKFTIKILHLRRQLMLHPIKTYKRVVCLYPFIIHRALWENISHYVLSEIKNRIKRWLIKYGK